MAKSRIFLSFFITIGFFACESDPDIHAPFVETPIIYSILEPRQDFQYFRVQKAFSGDNGNVVDLSKNPEMIYYDSAEIALHFTLIDPEEPERPYFDFPLLYIRCDTCKEKGEFFDEYLPLYHTYSFLPVDHESTTPLEASLSFENLVTGHTANATTGLVPCFEIINPLWECSYSNLSPRFVFDDFKIQLIGPPNGRLIHVTLDVFYFEIPKHGGSFKEKTTMNKPMEVISFKELDRAPGYQYTFSKLDSDFGDYLAAAIDTSNNSEVESRIIQGGGVAFMHFEIYNDDYFNFQLINNNQNGLQVDLNYSNINNGLGLLGAVVKREVNSIPIEIEDKDYWDQWPNLKHR